MDIGAWNRRWTFLPRWCPATLKEVFGFDMPIVSHAEEVGNLNRLLSFARNVDVAFMYRGLDLCSFKDPLNGFYLVKGADAW